MKILFREAARDDVVRQFRYYLVVAQRPDVAIRFRENFRKTIQVIAACPEIAAMSPFGKLKGLRSWPIQGFGQIRVYFTTRPEELKSSECCTANGTFDVS